ncbi:hypothetical protein MKW98_017506 [Papaver atlanticum]|uniref:Uncharacterized protein n=1 Tax=Papaver atlanticum TaxID=357466 RepID=A0AAD4TE59_9MAGN|nr:hypothetical protein MKW98_017506 [Papaver atlanticum]
MTGASMSTLCSRESSPIFNWSPSSPRRSPILSESAEFATWIGEISRSKIGLGHKNWKEVPQEYKEDIWDSVQNTYQVTQIHKKYVLTKANSAWRTEKSKQWRLVNGATTIEEKKRKVPTYYKKDDWERFITNNTSEDFQKKSEQGAQARSQVKAQYTGGRKGVPRRWLELEKESPTGEIYRPDVFLKTHKVTPDDNPSSSKSLAAAKLALVQEEYDKDPSAQKCLGTDTVTKIFGADRKGYIRGMGAGVSKSQFLSSEFMKARLQEEKHNVLKEKQKNEAFKAQLDAERQKNNTGVHDQISNSSYQQDIGMPVVPSSFDLFFLRNLRKKPVAVAYVDTKVLIDDDYDCMLHVIIEPSAMLCDRDDDIGNFIRWPKAYGTLVGEHSS